MDKAFYGCEKLTTLTAPENDMLLMALPPVGWTYSDGAYHRA